MSDRYYALRALRIESFTYKASIYLMGMVNDYGEKERIIFLTFSIYLGKEVFNMIRSKKELNSHALFIGPNNSSHCRDSIVMAINKNSKCNICI